MRMIEYLANQRILVGDVNKTESVLVVKKSSQSKNIDMLRHQDDVCNTAWVDDEKPNVIDESLFLNFRF